MTHNNTIPGSFPTGQSQAPAYDEDNVFINENKGKKITCKAFISQFSIQTASNNKEFAKGFINDKAGNKINFINWQQTTFTDAPDVFGAQVTGELEYNDFVKGLQFKITSVDQIFSNGSQLDWVPEVKSQAENFERFQELITSTASAKAIPHFNKIMQFDKFANNLYFNAMGSLNNHDAMKGGLAHHTNKVMSYAQTMINHHPESYTQDEKDILMIGIFIHDWGKMLVHSYDMKKSVQERHFLEHRVLLMEYLYLNQVDWLEEIATEYSPRLRDELIAIIMQHHGIYGERPLTKLAYIAHKADSLDAEITNAMENIKLGKRVPLGDNQYSRVTDTEDYVEEQNKTLR